MTIDEARRILLSDSDFCGVGEKAKRTADALCVAIEALECIKETTKLALDDEEDDLTKELLCRKLLKHGFLKLNEGYYEAIE